MSTLSRHVLILENDSMISSFIERGIHLFNEPEESGLKGVGQVYRDGKRVLFKGLGKKLSNKFLSKLSQGGKVIYRFSNDTEEHGVIIYNKGEKIYEKVSESFFN